MVKSSLEKIASLKGGYELFEFSWPANNNLSLQDAHKLVYQFGESIDSSAKKPIIYPQKGLHGVRVWNEQGDPYCAEDPGDLQLYKDWTKLEKDVSDVAKQQGVPNEQIAGFMIGFNAVDISYSLKNLVEASTGQNYPHFGEFKVASIFDLAKELDQFVKQTNPNADTSELSKLNSYKLKKLS